MSTMRSRGRLRTVPSMDEYLSITDLRALLRLGRSAAYALTHSPGFPDPVRLSGSCYRWPRPAVEAFLVSRTIPATQRPTPPAERAAPGRLLTGRTRPRRRRGGADA